MRWVSEVLTFSSNDALYRIYFSMETDNNQVFGFVILLKFIPYIVPISTSNYKTIFTVFVSVNTLKRFGYCMLS